MKLNKKSVFVPLSLSVAICAALSSNVSVAGVSNHTLHEYAQAPVVAKRVNIERNKLGVRELDMTNPIHMALAKERFVKAGKTEQTFPQLHNSLLELKAQQEQLKKFPALEKEVELDPAQLDIIENAHLFLDMNVAVAEDNAEPYLLIRAKSSVFGGTTATYVDLLLEDANGNQIAPMGSTFTVLDGKNTVVISTVTLKTLKQQFPNLDTIYASSYVETEDANGKLTSALKYTEYPFSWAHIDAAYNQLAASKEDTNGFHSKMISVANDGRPVYTATHPVDQNNDAVIKVCLNRSHSDCDYKADQIGDPNEITDVNIPFAGQIVVGHEITQIYATDTPVGERPNGIDEITNVYLQEGNYGGATKQSYKGLEGTIKSFSDYLEFDVDPDKKETLISWNIPRAEGRFGNAKLFSNIAEANWYITFAVKGFPYFNHGRGGRESNFQISITSEEASRFGNYYTPVLPKIKLGYSCLAKGTLITMADGTQLEIEKIQEGDFVMGAQANNAMTAEAMEVVDVSVGIEAIQMYRIHTGDESILMTETHPVSTSNKGIVWASELEPGDRILSKSGSALVTEVATEYYKDNIYNLKLKPSKESTLSGKRDLGMFANNMLVGDLSAQDKFNYKYQGKTLTQEEVLEQLPEKWKTDYINSL
ncbi:Hint domain-containing protein [Aestuariibacter sp. AA17]|uniref:Hint domain-containing protein n=1 Tax=Fluctibacter corallii TaxID=2984329 RepID=A0ABT3ABN5_9ALTE|nr:Hint domain-containing protein [Aestuariibacter sp. AA17]MCV2885691.1 Hint domain-containing protein [Aestuariibacter sp. AA17]